MFKSLSVLLLMATLLGATLFTVTGQSPSATLAPFLIDLHQQIPTTVTLFLDDGITATLPLTLAVNLQIAVASPTSATLSTSAPVTPTFLVTAPAIPSQPGEGQFAVDDLNYPYQLTTIDENLVLTEWTAYQDSRDHLTYAGELKNTSTNQRFSLADIVVRFYRIDDSLLAVETFAASGHWVDPDQNIRFKGTTSADPALIDHYTIAITSQDWTAVP